ncbi:hypothetical protein NDU88_005116 [Pleurodeles waltl]|uniref:Uncharacterized protein n=1 Tax=Pleurodeles waltl TaxID=8319 RepID=A0AAV7MVT4_PLEWA|nr:hypothetical protein NDU88_005116 [Pleurodeles waltl]
MMLEQRVSRTRSFSMSFAFDTEDRCQLHVNQMTALIGPHMIVRLTLPERRVVPALFGKASLGLYRKFCYNTISEWFI